MAVRIIRTGVGLIIGIVVLALIVLGGLYLAKQRGDQARREEAIQIAQQNLEAESEKTDALNSGDSGADKEAEGSRDGAENGRSSGELSPTSTVPELPQTGPEDTAQLLGAGLLAFAAVSYLASRRTLLETK